MKYIDVHAHIEMCKNTEEIINQAKEKNVLVVAVGVDVKSNRKVLEIKKRFPEILICIGIYPKHGLEMTESEIDSEIEFIKKNKRNLVGIGEVGLDLKESGNLEKQKEVLGKFVELAKELNFPIIIHSRKAEEIAVEFLEGFNYNKIIMHCFSGNMKLVKRILKNDWFFSIPTNIKHSEHFQKLVEIIPIEKLFCETDSPYLHPDKKFPNEPANVIESYKKIAEIKKMNLKEVQIKIFENWEKLQKR